MTTELFYLLLTAILTGVLWIPVVIGYVSSRGLLKPEDFKIAPTSPLPHWVDRANRAHINAVENLAPFAVAVLVAHETGVSTPVTAIAATVFFYARAAHALLHISGFSLFLARTVAFTLGWLAFAAFAFETLRRAA